MQANAVVTRSISNPAVAMRQPWWRQFTLVLRVHFSDYKDSALTMALFSMLLPLGLMWLLGGNVAGVGPGAVWFLAGNAVMTVSFSCANFTIYRVGYLRLNKELDYFATLPVSRTAFLAALFCIAQLTALPGLIAGLFAGSWLLQIPATSVVAGLPLALLAAGSLTMVAAVVGSLPDTWGRLNLYGNLVYFVVMFLSPVMAPPERLPLLLRWTSHALPTGQAALALTEAFSGRFGATFWLYVGLLVLWLVAGIWLALKKLDWRSD